MAKVFAPDGNYWIEKRDKDQYILGRERPTPEDLLILQEEIARRIFLILHLQARHLRQKGNAHSRERLGKINCHRLAFWIFNELPENVLQDPDQDLGECTLSEASKNPNEFKFPFIYQDQILRMIVEHSGIVLGEDPEGKVIVVEKDGYAGLINIRTLSWKTLQKRSTFFGIPKANDIQINTWRRVLKEIYMSLTKGLTGFYY